MGRKEMREGREGKKESRKEGRKEEESHRRASQQSKEVLVQRRRAGVKEQQPVGPLQRGGRPAGRGGVSLPVLLHVQDGGQQGGLELLQLLLQHQQEEGARHA